MKKFLLQLVLFIALLLLAFLLSMFRAGTNTDEYYYRFATPAQNSLVLGTSRAAQGINPEVINQALNRGDVFNYAFTNEQSPYGAVYLKSIRKKLKPDASNGIFILAVDPWSLGVNNKHVDDSTDFLELGQMLDKMPVVNMNPNIFYLMQHYDHPYSDVLAGNYDPQLILHKNGWLEVTVPMDTASVNARTSNKIKTYREDVLPGYQYSENRLHFLQQTIRMLSQHGKVYLVRLPVSSEMYDIEDKMNNDFDMQIDAISNEMNVPYFNMRHEPQVYSFTDGNHLAKVSVELVSAQIAHYILKHP